ncbi:hypothetical protein ACVBEF_04370 [Glaciimonas sp. GG7]
MRFFSVDLRRKRSPESKEDVTFTDEWLARAVPGAMEFDTQFFLLQQTIFARQRWLF